MTEPPPQRTITLVLTLRELDLIADSLACLVVHGRRDEILKLLHDHKELDLLALPLHDLNPKDVP